MWDGPAWRLSVMNKTFPHSGNLQSLKTRQRLILFLYLRRSTSISNRKSVRPSCEETCLFAFAYCFLDSIIRKDPTTKTKWDVVSLMNSISACSKRDAAAFQRRFGLRRLSNFFENWIIYSLAAGMRKLRFLAFVTAGNVVVFKGPDPIVFATQRRSNNGDVRWECFSFGL